ncbi:hypothetical protein [Zavarzinella formosa]|uniref:hypothetical protein n=1 Tax=Zavarzinella formosa TaxID=360055 RepID=UPI00031F6ABD|nr:hypothetical protein [Zavarzinella formosa]
MNAITSNADLLDDPVLQETDALAVQEFVANGAPLDPAVRERVFARAARLRQQILQTHGSVDWERFRNLSTDDA